MARTSGDVATPSDAVPAARRGARPAWRDPRLWVGVVIVAASVVAGARVFAGADDTVQVWAAAQTMGAGQSVAAADLVAERVHFADHAEQAAYFTADQALPADVRLTRGVGAGELLARSAVGSSRSTGLLEIPIAVDPQQVPDSVEAGAVVDVYVLGSGSGTATGAGTASGGATSAGRAMQPALADVTVVDAPAVSESFGATGKRQLVLAVKDSEAQAFFAELAAQDDPTLTVVRRG